ncbi:MAG: hypothetical protein U0800_19310 [Isosphaeraceae bacterium]
MNPPPLPGLTPEEIARHRAAAEAMFPAIEGRPAVYVEPSRDQLRVFAIGKVSNLRMEVDSVWWTNDWLDRKDSWPDEITDEFFISEDCLTVGPGCWYDTYFGSWFLFDPERVARSLAGDDGWIPAYLKEHADLIPPFIEVDLDAFGPPVRLA